jgi:hypothetical protein
VHWKLGVSRGDPENIIRQVNDYPINEKMDRDAQVSAAFASLKKTLEQGKPRPWHLGSLREQQTTGTFLKPSLQGIVALEIVALEVSTVST